MARLCLCIAIWAQLSLAQLQIYSPLPKSDPVSQVLAQLSPGAHVDNLTLNPPSYEGQIPTQVSINSLTPSSNLSLPVNANFLGLSIELSVADQILGPSSSDIRTEFLNYVSNIKARSGTEPLLRVGGNSQDYSILEPVILDSHGEVKLLDKVPGQASGGPTASPFVNYSPEIFYLMANISSLVGATWYFGIPFANITPSDGNQESIAQIATQILGSNLVALQLGNEPDLYQDHNKRAAPYSIANYITEFSRVSADILNVDADVPRQSAFVGPSTCCNTDFTIDQIFQQGYLNQFGDILKQISVQKYPSDNCLYVGAPPPAPQDALYGYLRHDNQTSLAAQYADPIRQAVAAGKDFVLFETNTASCAGFPGISDSFASALWLTDWAMTLAASNFSAALVHVGGQNSYYNPFTPPPANLTATAGWTTGPTYYAVLLIAEVFQGGKTQVTDLTQNIYQPIYGLFESGQMIKVLAINFVDPSVQASFTLDITTSASQASVKLLSAPSVTSKQNISLAGLSFGGILQGTGMPTGQESVQVVQCNSGTCSVTIPGSAVALIYLENPPAVTYAPQTFTQTYAPGSTNVPASILAASYGNGGPQAVLGTSSRQRNGSSSGAVPRIVIIYLSLLVYLIVT